MKFPSQANLPPASGISWIQEIESNMVDEQIPCDEVDEHSEI